jgi:hypothetical protein
MHLLQMFIPLADNHGKRFPRSKFEEVERELVAKFEGFTAYPRASANGLWVSPSDQLKRDDIVIYEVMSAKLDRPWWKAYRAKLEEQFRQDALVIRTTVVEVL